MGQLNKMGIGQETFINKDNWTPHCTLASRLSEAEVLKGVDVMSSISLPVDLVIDSIAALNCDEDSLLYLFPVNQICNVNDHRA